MINAPLIHITWSPVFRSILSLMFPSSNHARPDGKTVETETNLLTYKGRLFFLVYFIFALLAGLPLVAYCESIRVGDIEISPEDFSATLASEKRIAKCLSCHGSNAGGDIDFGPDAHYGTPALRGLRESYVKESLIAYRTGTRKHREMSAVSSLLDGETIEFMARIWLEFEVPPMRPDSELAALAETDSLFRTGQSIAREGIPQQGVPACIACHGSRGEGGAAGPRLAGQSVMYIRNQFESFASGTRQTFQSAAMQPVVAALTDEDLEAVAHYYESVSVTAYPGDIWGQSKN